MAFRLPDASWHLEIRHWHLRLVIIIGWELQSLKNATLLLHLLGICLHVVTYVDMLVAFC